jgi:hypothetical protein
LEELNASRRRPTDGPERQRSVAPPQGPAEHRDTSGPGPPLLEDAPDSGDAPDGFGVGRRAQRKAQDEGRHAKTLVVKRHAFSPPMLAVIRGYRSARRPINGVAIGRLRQSAHWTFAPHAPRHPAFLFLPALPAFDPPAGHRGDRAMKRHTENKKSRACRSVAAPASGRRADPPRPGRHPARGGVGRSRPDRGLGNGHRSAHEPGPQARHLLRRAAGGRRHRGRPSAAHQTRSSRP